MDDSILDTDLSSGDILVEDTPPGQTSPATFTRNLVNRFGLQSQHNSGSETATLNEIASYICFITLTYSGSV